jgi:hypothetical protein
LFEHVSWQLKKGTGYRVDHTRSIGASQGEDEAVVGHENTSVE